MNALPRTSTATLVGEALAIVCLMTITLVGASLPGCVRIMEMAVS
jgi:hypothetical protein